MTKRSCRERARERMRERERGGEREREGEGERDVEVSVTRCVDALLQCDGSTEVGRRVVDGPFFKNSEVGITRRRKRASCWSHRQHLLSGSPSH